jgi:hypothetical protein
LTSDIAGRIRALPWQHIQQVAGDARDVPDALLALAQASEPADVAAAYWRLDNHVVVQGSLYEAAFHIVPFLLELLADRSRTSRTALYDLLVEIAAGQPAFPGDVVMKEDGTAAELGDACRERIRAGLGMIREDLLRADTDPAVRDRALHVLIAVEPDQTALRETLGRVPGTGDTKFATKVRRAIESLDRPDLPRAR